MTLSISPIRIQQTNINRYQQPQAKPAFKGGLFPIGLALLLLGGGDAYLNDSGTVHGLDGILCILGIVFMMIRGGSASNEAEQSKD